MAPSAHQVFLPAGESISGLWVITDATTHAPLDPLLASCEVWRPGAELVDWSAFLTQPGAGELALDTDGPATGALAPGRWTAQVWAAFVADHVPDVLIATIDLRVSIGLPTVPTVAVSGIAL